MMANSNENDTLPNAQIESTVYLSGPSESFSPEMMAPQEERSISVSAQINSWLDRPLFAALSWEKVLYVALIVMAVLTRFWDLGARVMSHDESLHTYFSYQLATGKGFSHTPLMHGPFLFHITALSYFLFGADDFTSRLPTAVFGVALVAMPYFFRRQLGRVGALVTAALLLISPSILYHARYIRQEAFILVWVTLTVLCVWRYLETRRAAWLVGLAIVLAFHATDKSTSFLTVAWVVVFAGVMALRAFYLLRQSWRDVVAAVQYVGFLGLAMLIVCIAMEALARWLSQALGLADGVIQSGPGMLSLNAQLIGFAVVILLAGAGAAAALAWVLWRAFGWWLNRAVAHVPWFNLIVVMVTTTMFMAAPAMLLVLNPLWQRFTGEVLISIDLLGTMSNLSLNTQVITTMFALSIAMASVSVAIGVTWNWRLWLIVLAVFGLITVTLFTTVFTNAAGIGTGFVGQLGYWMAQHPVQRGSQPWYYYFLLVPLYEYLPLAGALGAFVVMIGRGLAQLAHGVLSAGSTVRAPASPESVADAHSSLVTPLSSATDIPAQAQPSPAHLGVWPAFIGWWALASFAIFTIAGEKMPWLTVHIALPMTFLAGWFVDQVVRPASNHSRSEMPAGTLLIGALAGLSVALIVRLLSLIGGLDIAPGDTARLVGWIGTFGLTGVVLVGVVAALHWMAGRWAWRAITLAAILFGAILTVRTAYMVTYINYDYTREFLFYAHGAPGVKLALKQLEDLSKRLKGGDGIRIGYDSETSWPMSWYMRLFPKARFIGNDLPVDYLDLEAILISDQNPKRGEIEPQLLDNYSRFRYTLVWWPMQDYFDLTWERIAYSLFNPTARAALWDIIFNRDFTRYSKVFNKTTLTADTWSPSHRFSLYLRNDLAAQVWDYRVGQIATGAGAAVSAVTARLQAPTGIAVAANRDRLVIDRKANRLFRLNADNVVQSAQGGLGIGDGRFNDAWGLAIDRDGSIYVADTFNHRIQKFDAAGNFLFAWGQPGVSAADGEGRNTIFFGPRAIVIDRQNRLLVTDTGNKRVQIFDRDGNFLAQFGREGSAEGEFNEPVGLAVDSAGNIYVADTWNQRIQVFDSEFRLVRAWTVAAWQNMDPAVLRSVDHKPFLIVSGNTLYVSSPGTSEVLAYTLAGEWLETGLTMPAGSLPTGLAVDGDTLLVTDAANGQILQFRLDATMR
ncbi:MAG: TIGR03663 family protein [Anaerolineae bacterium]|nr:TIGR03663 family protein [Thermoflexales bacterium]MDW8407281.1 TIGR03663 family protein [Anaerolineae bacterium]